jgi:beta-phosphoglucomutase-like phosphatase (HAD superfamily)
MEFHLDPASFRALIFDCDGTLVETLPAHIAALRTTLGPLGILPTAEWARGLYGTTPPQVLLAIEKTYGNIPAPHAEILKLWVTNYAKSLHLLERIAPVCEIATRFQGKVPMSVASNNQRANIEATLKAVGLDDCFGWIVSGEDVAKGKPAPDLFLEAARRMQVAPQDCLVFEDSREGVEAAEAAGMHVIRIDAGVLVAHPSNSSNTQTASS